MALRYFLKSNYSTNVFNIPPGQSVHIAKFPYVYWCRNKYKENNSRQYLEINTNIVFQFLKYLLNHEQKPAIHPL